MLNLIQNLSYNMSVEVVDPAWHTLAAEIAGCSTVDEVQCSACSACSVCVQCSVKYTNTISAFQVSKQLLEPGQFMAALCEIISITLRDALAPDLVTDQWSGSKMSCSIK